MALIKEGWQRSKMAKAIPSDRISQLYPCVDETETPLPRSWSSRERCQSITLSQNNLRVQYKGNTNKAHKDAASVRATHPISPACGIYYYEVKIVSKGKDGYIGVGLSVHNSNLNRLPGWEKHTFGYHGDDGHSFNSQSHGDPYGPTFTTGDIIGCGVNFVHNTCFYTKNGRNLGTVFSDLPHDLYPTVGMQTIGEIVDTNFGQEPFLYNIEDEIQEARVKVSQTVLNTAITSQGNSVQAMLHKVIIDYLVHHGYSATCETFATITGQSYKEETTSIENRQKIQALIMNGKISEAISLTEKFYPTILSDKPWLHVRLLVRQFIETIDGSDTVSHASGNAASVANSNSDSSDMVTSPSSNNVSQNNECEIASPQNGFNSSVNDDSVMDVDEEKTREVNGTDSNDHVNGVTTSCNQEDENQSKPSDDLKSLLSFGKNLKAMYDKLKKEGPTDDEIDNTILRDAFSLLAYRDPHSSPLAHLLSRKERESIYYALNSAILEAQNMSKVPALEVIVNHTDGCLKKMAKAGIGTCAFASLDKILEC